MDRHRSPHQGLEAPCLHHSAIKVIGLHVHWIQTLTLSLQLHVLVGGNQHIKWACVCQVQKVKGDRTFVILQATWLCCSAPRDRTSVSTRLHQDVQTSVSRNALLSQWDCPYWALSHSPIYSIRLRTQSFSVFTMLGPALLWCCD